MWKDLTEYDKPYEKKTHERGKVGLFYKRQVTHLLDKQIITSCASRSQCKENAVRYASYTCILWNYCRNFVYTDGKIIQNGQKSLRKSNSIEP
jgi:hypothetical protein